MEKATRTKLLAGRHLATHGSFCSGRDVHQDLDPAYTDRFGRTLMQITYDFQPNEPRISVFLTDKGDRIAKRVNGVRQTVRPPRTGRGISCRIR